MYVKSPDKTAEKPLDSVICTFPGPEITPLILPSPEASGNLKSIMVWLLKKAILLAIDLYAPKKNVASLAASPSVICGPLSATG